MYSWFVPSSEKILDPFAGGSVRGIVAEKLGFKYTGIERRPEQVIANIKQEDNLGVSPLWIPGDSQKILDKIAGKYDFILTCPPYFNLEKYSDLEGDLSNYKNYDDFLKSYNTIIKKSVSKLKDNRFSSFVVSDIRDGGGYFRGFDYDTISAFKDAGMDLYNKAVLINSTGSLYLRGNKIWTKNKFGRHHQQVLV